MLALAAALVLLVPVSTAAAKPLSAVPTSPLAKAGSKLKLTVKGKGSTAFLLSRDRRRGKGDIALGSRTLRRARTKLALTVPRGTPLGAYHLLSCSPPRGTSCRATSSRIAVTARPRPARVRPRLDTARAVSADIGRGGGTVTATAADGTRITLTLPAGALLDPATVTLTPVSSAGRLPMGARGLRAVQIGPAGLDLAKPGSLEIVPPKRVARPLLTGLGFNSGGAQFHLTPVSAAGSTATLRVFELEGLGIASAKAGARYLFSRTRMPTSLVDQLQQVAAVPRAPRGARASQAGPSDELSAQLFALAVTVQALATSGNVDAAVIQFIPWDALSLGLASRYPGLVGWRALVAQGFRTGFTREIAGARAACLGGDIRQMGRLLRFRDYLYTSLASLQLQSLRSDIDSVVSRCLRFELDYEVTIAGANVYNESVDARVSSTVPVESPIPGDTDFFSGTAPLVVGSYVVGPADCYTHTWNVTPLDAFVVKQMRVGVRRSIGAETLPADIRMKFSLGSLDEQVTHNCPEFEQSYTDQQHAYDGVAAALLGGEAGADFELSWTSAGSGSEYSSQTFTKSTAVDGSYTGTFSFKLRHTPR